MTGRFSAGPGRVKIVVIALWGSFDGAGFPLNIGFGVFLPESQGQNLQGLQRPVG